MKKKNQVLVLVVVSVFLSLTFVSSQGLLPKPKTINISATNISNLGDVNADYPSNNNFLRYDSGSGKWILYSFNLGDYWNYDYSDLINTPTSLSQFIDDLGDRGYTNNLNFTNGAGYYNASDFVISDYATNVKVNSLGNWSNDKSNYYTSSQVNALPISTFTNDNNYWNDTFATFNKTYADTLYASSSIVGDNSSWNESYANTLYAPINYGDNWNKTYADTLYYGINNPYNFYNSTNPQPIVNSSYYLKSNPYNFYNSTTIPDFALNSKVDSLGNFSAWNKDYNDLINTPTIPTNNNQLANGNGYYNSSDFVISNYYLNSNPYGFYNSTTIPDFALNSKVNSLGNWSADKSSYSTTATILGWNYYNSTDFNINDYYPKSNPYNFYNSTNPQPIVNSSYYLNSNPYNFYNSTNFDINDYYLKSNPFGFYNSTTLTSNSQLINGNNYWNDTFATFNKTYADTLYASFSNGSLWDNLGNNIYYNGGNVGIGTSTPQNELNVIGEINSTGNITSSGDICARGKCLSEAQLAKEFSVNVTTSGGSALFTTPTEYNNNIISFIVTANTTTTTFNFDAHENNSLTELDSSRELHTGRWYIVKNVACINDNITMKVDNSSVDEQFNLKFTYN